MRTPSAAKTRKAFSGTKKAATTMADQATSEPQHGAPGPVDRGEPAEEQGAEEGDELDHENEGDELALGELELLGSRRVLLEVITVWMPSLKKRYASRNIRVCG
jgi:hypothetical protein